MNTVQVQTHWVICPACGECRKMSAGVCPNYGKRLLIVSTEKRALFLGSLPREERLQYVRGEVPLRRRKRKRGQHRLYRVLPLRETARDLARR